MKFCIECGTEIQLDESKFCPNCGKSLLMIMKEAQNHYLLGAKFEELSATNFDKTGYTVSRRALENSGYLVDSLKPESIRIAVLGQGGTSRSPPAKGGINW